MRVLLSYDFAATENVTLGARAGFAFRGNPGDFVPFHGEARVAYWFTGLGAKFRPYLHLAGGFAEVDAGVELQVQDCSAEGFDGPSLEEGEAIDEQKIVRCAEARNEYDSGGTEADNLPKLDVIAYKKLGFGFVGAGAGVVYGVTDAVGVQLNVNAMYMLGSVGFVLEPSLGANYSF
jgi:hypothetical protein